MAGDLDYVATLDNKQILAALKQIDAAITKQTSQASKEFQQLGKAAKNSGVEIGAVSGVVSSLTTSFINLGQSAVNALIDIGKQSVQTAVEVDVLKARLGGIFDGSEEAANQAFTFIQQKSKELGFDLSEVAGAFLPKTESLAQFERVAKIATALARSDPEQGAIGARIALIEALSGTFTSLQRRFEIPKDDIETLKSAFDKEGIEGFLTAFDEVLKNSGRSFEDLADTAQTAFAKLEISGQQLGGKLGAPILQALEDAANKINEFIGANEDDLIIFADTIGRAIADVINFISSVDLSQLDTQQLIEFGDFIFSVVNALELLVTQLSGFVSTFTGFAGSIGPINDGLTFLSRILTDLDDALLTLSQTLAIAKSGYVGLFTAIEPLLPLLGSLLKAVGQSATGDFLGAAESLVEATSQLGQAQFDLEAGQQAANASLLESAKSIEEYQKSLEDNKTAQQDLRTELEETANAGTDAADAILAAGAAEKQAAEDAAAFQEAQEKVNKALADAELDFTRKLQDINIAAERKRLDIAIEFAQKREDAARDNLQKLEDIQRGYANDVQDAATDLARKEEDIARKFGDERIDLEREQRQKRVDIERTYRRTLQDIQAQFNIDADEAEKKRDAVGFLRALQQRNQKINEAQINRQQSITDARTEGERRREELRLQQERELEEARIANERKLEDLRTNLERQIEEQNTAYQRQLEDLAISEQRKIDEANMARERDIEDAKRAYDRKLEDLQLSLAAELAILQEGNAALEAEQARHNEAMAAEGALPQTPSQGAAQSGSTSTGSARNNSNKRGRGPGRAGGGSVIKSSPYIVGERGPELFVPSSNGKIIPNNALTMANLQPKSSISNISNSKSQQINLPVTDTGLLQNPIFVAGLRNIILNELDKVNSN